MEIKSGEEPLPMGRAALARAICMDWIVGHGKTILLSFVTLIVLAFCLYLIGEKLTGGSGSDYADTERAFHSWVSSESPGAAEFKQLEKPLHRHPELEAKFGALIAQRLLAIGDVKKGEAYARAALKRTEDLNSPYYAQFSKNSLIITAGKFKEALASAEKLKAQMFQDDAFWSGRDKLVHSGSALYAYNLVRIAMLYQKLEDKTGELNAWEELIQNAGWKGMPSTAKTYDPEAYNALLQNFTQGDLSLLDYIEQRKA